MRRLLSLLVPFALLVPATAARAQSVEDLAAWGALLLTPQGGLPSLPPVSGSDFRAPNFSMRYGRIEPGASAFNNLAIGGQLGVGPGRLGLTLGTTFCEDCDETLMLGADLHVPLVEQGLHLGLRPAVGFALPFDDDDDGGNAYAVTIGLPLGLPLRGDTGPLFLPYVEPTFALAGFTGDDGENGTRFMLGGGVLLADRRGRLGLHVGVSRVFIEDGETLLGVGVMLGGGGGDGGRDGRDGRDGRGRRVRR